MADRANSKSRPPPFVRRAAGWILIGPNARRIAPPTLDVETASSLVTFDIAGLFAHKPDVRC